VLQREKTSRRSGPSASFERSTARARRPGSFPIACIGASAGGLEAFGALLTALSAHPGLALVFVQHLDPKHQSLLPEILSRPTRMPVMEAQDGVRVRPDHVYIIPPNADLAIARGILRVMPRTTTRGQHLPVDVFLRSLAEDQKNKAIGVILSGTASDGALGLKAIKAEGGIAFAQDEQSAKYGGMPRSAVVAGVVDFVLPPEGIARELERFGHHPYLTSQKAVASEDLLPESRDSLAEIFHLLRKAFGTDFTEYKDTTIRRRIKRRMVLRKMEEPQAYVQFLKEHPDEVEALYHDILINVTSFLRDPATFNALKLRVFPAILGHHRPDAPLRVWVPGCATGEEAYSVAICLLEFLGTKRIVPSIQIFGTDVSQSAIERARPGLYLENIALDVSPERLNRFFVRVEGGGYQISKSVRDLCVFAQHDLTKDPPFSRLDLISCRNLLIYLGSVLQRRILPMFHYALQPYGFLMLGGSETVGSFTHQFHLVDKKNKIYAKKETVTRPRLDFPPVQGALDRVAGGDRRPGREARPEFDPLKEADRVVQAHYAPAGVLLNDEMEVLQFRGHTSDYLEPAAGTASFDVMKMAREGLLPDLRGAIQEARKGRSPVRREGLRVKSGDRRKIVHLSVHAIRVPHRAEQFFLVLFEEPAASPAEGLDTRRLVPRAAGRAGAVRERRETEELRREVAATKEYLQSIVEEQEATNEELKTANEEILSSNEELQSTNEELETAKEELQSSNEELTTVNEELQNRNLEISQANNDLLNLFSSINIPVVMLGPDLRIRRFTPQAEKVLNLIPGDMGRPMTDIRLNIDLPNADELIRETIDTASVRHLEVQDRQGRWYSLWIRPYKTSDNKIDGAILALLDVHSLKKQTGELASAKAELEVEIADHKRALEELRRFKLISDNANDAQDLIDRTGRLLYVNRRACERLGYSEVEMLKMTLSDIDPLYPEERVRELFQRIEEGDVGPFESLRRRKDGTTFPVEVSVIGLRFDGEPSLFIVARDITDRKKAERRFHLAVEAAPNGMVMVNQEGKILLVNAQMERLFGYSRNELLGMSVEKLVPERFRAKHAGFRKGFFAGPQARPMGAGRDLYAQRKDGSEFPVEIGLSPIETDEGIWVLGAVVDISERRRAEETLRKAHDGLELRVQERTVQLRETVEQLNVQVAERKRAEQERREVSARLIRLQDDERRRLAQELHDNTGQNLAALKMSLGALQEGPVRLDPKTRKTLAESQELAEQCIREVRTLSYLLHPPLLNERGLASALRVYAEGFSERSGVPLEIEVPDEFGRLPQELEIALFRLAQECLTNIHRHSGSATARVRLEKTDSDVRLEISDAGRGFPTGAPRDIEERGIGIRAMRERAQQLGGRLEIDSDSSGTRVLAVLPLPHVSS